MKDRILNTSQLYQKLLWNCHIIKEYKNKEILRKHNVVPNVVYVFTAKNSYRR